MLKALRGQLGNPTPRRRWLLGGLVLMLSTLPLVGTLGYENAFVLSPVLSMLGVAIGVDTVREARKKGSATTRVLCAAAATELAQLLGVALAVSAVVLVWQRNCDPWTGMLFFLMGPAASGAAGVVVGLWGGLLAKSRRRQWSAAVLVLVASTTIGAWRLIADPVIFAYDPFWGYFSGAIYDEDVGVRQTYVVFRLYNLLGIAAALQVMALSLDPQRLTLRTLAEIHGGLRSGLARAFAAIVCATVAIGIGATGAQWGFTANIATISAALSATRETQHFIIHYNPRSAEARTIDAIALEHELAWARLRRLMDGREPKDKVRSFVFASSGQKRTLMGAGTVQVAAPWRNQIYLDHRAFPHPVLHHELAHVFGKTIGDDLFGVALSGLHLNIALIEGFATAMAPRASDHLDLHDQALVLERLQRRPTLPSIMGPSFFTKSSRVAYTTAGSFCLWLIDTRGFSGMATLYRTAGDFEAAFGESLLDLERQWLAFLEARGGVSEDDVESQRQRFKRQSVFRRPCAHRAANLASEIRAADRQGRHADVIALYGTLCTIEPDDTAHRIGLAWAQAMAGDFDGALASLDEAAATQDLTVTLRAALESRRAEVALSAGNLAEAVRAETEALTLPMRRGTRRTHQLRLAAAQDPELTDLIVTYLAPFASTTLGKTAAVRRLFAAMKVADAPGYRALGSYLMGRQLLNAQMPKAAAEQLATALNPKDGDGTLPSPQFVRAAHIALLSATVQAGDYAQARTTVAALAALPESGHGDALVAALWRERIEFFANNAELAAPR